MPNSLNARVFIPRQVREDEEIAGEIQSYVEFDHVPHGYMIRQLLRLGLEQKRLQLGEETVVLLRQLRSPAPGPKSTPVNLSQPASRKTA